MKGPSDRLSPTVSNLAREMRNGVTVEGLHEEAPEVALGVGNGRPRFGAQHGVSVLLVQHEERQRSFGGLLPAPQLESADLARSGRTGGGQHSSFHLAPHLHLTSALIEEAFVRAGLGVHVEPNDVITSLGQKEACGKRKVA